MDIKFLLTKMVLKVHHVHYMLKTNGGMRLIIGCNIRDRGYGEKLLSEMGSHWANLCVSFDTHLYFGNYTDYSSVSLLYTIAYYA